MIVRINFEPGEKFNKIKVNFDINLNVYEMETKIPEVNLELQKRFISFVLKRVMSLYNSRKLTKELYNLDIRISQTEDELDTFSFIRFSPKEGIEGNEVIELHKKDFNFTERDFIRKAKDAILKLEEGELKLEEELNG